MPDDLVGLELAGGHVCVDHRPHAGSWAECQARRNAFAKVNEALDRYGDGPEYRAAWARFAAFTRYGGDSD